MEAILFLGTLGLTIWYLLGMISMFVQYDEDNK